MQLCDGGDLFRALENQVVEHTKGQLCWYRRFDVHAVALDTFLYLQQLSACDWGTGRSCQTLKLIACHWEDEVLDSMH